MGQEIVYCYKCQIRLVGSDFERGKAFRVGANVACINCVEGLLANHPDPKAELERLKRGTGGRISGTFTISSSQLRAQKAESPPPLRMPSSTHRIPVVETAPAPPNRTALAVGLGFAGLAAVLAAVWAFSGRPSPRPPEDTSVRVTSEPKSTPPPPPEFHPPPPPPPPSLKDELAELDERIRPLVGQGQIRDAAAVLEAAGPRHSEPEWSLGLASRQGLLLAEGRRRTAPLFEQALKAARRGDVTEVQGLRKQIELQSTQALLGEFDRTVTGVVVTSEAEPKPPAPVAPAPPSPAASALDRYRADWARAAALAAQRDFPAALGELEKAAAGLKDAAAKAEAEQDLGDLKLAQEALAELPRLAPHCPRGQKMTLEFLGETGALESFEGTIAAADATRVQFQVGPGILDIPLGELGGVTAGTFLGYRGEKRPTDARAALVVSALDGHVVPGLGPKYASLRREPEPAELDARHRFFEAQENLGSSRTRALAAAAFTQLLETAASTGLVTRNRRFIEDRLVELRDTVFFAEDLSGSGTFLPWTPPRGEAAWLSTADSAPGKQAANYVEAQIFVQAGPPVHAWVHAAGCCQEVLTFALQGTGLSGPSAKNPRESVAAEPGGEEAVPVRPQSMGLKKKHSDHMGPKNPERWEWISLGALKFEGTGLRKLRVLTDQKGFAVDGLVVSSTRSSPPRESEFRDLQKARPAADLGPTGEVHREIFRDIPGASVSDLLQSQKFKENRPDLSGMVSALDSWNMGENYGCRMRAYVHPPITGEYHFWIASDDSGELWLSTDDSPAHRVRIASIGYAVGPHEYERDPSQKSAPIALVAGKRYYIEALQKQATGPENVSVGWTLPGGRQERPIPPIRLSAFGVFPPRRVPRILAPTLASDAPVAQSALVGGSGGTLFEDAPLPRQFLKGLRWTVTSRAEFSRLQPLYQTAGGTLEGRAFGNDPGNLAELVGRPGYVVGGMIVRGTDRLNAFRLVFMRLSGAHLLPFDRYESDWIEARPGGAPVELGGDGTPVLGLCGRSGACIDSAGLILLQK